MQIEQLGVFGVRAVELEKGLFDLLHQPFVQVTPHRPVVIYVGWSGPEDEDLSSIDLLGIDQLLPDGKIQCTSIDSCRLDPECGGIMCAAIAELAEVLLRDDAGLQEKIARHRMTRCRAGTA